MSAQADLSRWEYLNLSPAERDVYSRAAEGESPTAIAAETDRAATTVRTLLHRARRKRGEAPDV